MVERTLAKGMLTIGERLCGIHEDIRKDFPALCRIAVAVYDPETEILKTFAHSTDGASPISFYQTELDHAPSLKKIAESGEVRIIEDLSQLQGDSEHSRRLTRSGFLSSMTQPIIFNEKLYGFLFFNSAEKNYFSHVRLATMRAYAGVISLLVVNELQNLGTFKGALKTAREFSRHRDEETGNHLERMSRYARLIALDLAPRHGKNDDWVEYIFQFAPLHDVGKIAISDDILLKPGRLTTEEFEVMKTHVQKGGEIIDVMSDQFGLNSLTFFAMLKNIVVHHHECLDGSGYPKGLKGDDIPLESRIVAVADVFDALTSCRPYKERWSNEMAFETLLIEAGIRLDKECVDSLLSHKDQIIKIQNEFGEDFIG